MDDQHASGPSTSFDLPPTATHQQHPTSLSVPAKRRYPRRSKAVDSLQSRSAEDGPSSVVSALPAEVNGKVEDRRRVMLQQRTADMKEVMDGHDELIREAFHLDKFVTLIGYDPELAKEDNSNVFKEYRSQYDLVNVVASSVGSSSRKKTRGRDSENAGVFASLSAMIGRDDTNDTKGKGRATEVGALPPAALARRGKGRGRGAIVQNGRELQETRPGARFTRGVSGTSTLSSSQEMDTDDLHLPYARGQADQSIKRRSGRPRKRPPEGVLPSASPPQAVPLASPLSTLTLKRGPELLEPYSRVKRIKVIHRPPPPEYTDPDQRPRPPKFSRSVDAFLDSYTAIEDDDLSVADLEKMAQDEARLRSQIATLRAQGKLRVENDEVPAEAPVTCEPKRSQAHWDHLITHAVALSKRMVDESKNRQAVVKKISRAMAAHHERLATAEDRERHAEEKRLRALAKVTVKEVMKKWREAIHHVREMKSALAKQEQAKLGKKQLNAILEQSSQVLEAQHLDLSRAIGRSRSRSGSAPVSWQESRSDMSEEDEEGDVEKEDEEDEQGDGDHDNVTDEEGGSDDEHQVNAEKDRITPDVYYDEEEEEDDEHKADNEDYRAPQPPDGEGLEALLEQPESDPPEEAVDVRLKSPPDGPTEDSKEEFAEGSIPHLPLTNGFRPLSRVPENQHGDDYAARISVNGHSARTPLLSTLQDAAMDSASKISSSPPAGEPLSHHASRKRVSINSSSVSISTGGAADSAMGRDAEDTEFIGGAEAEREDQDRQMDEAMEAEDEDYEEDSDQEIGALEADAHVPVEELLRQYGYALPGSDFPPSEESRGSDPETDSAEDDGLERGSHVEELAEDDHTPVPAVGSEDRDALLPNGAVHGTGHQLQDGGGLVAEVPREYTPSTTIVDTATPFPGAGQATRQDLYIKEPNGTFSLLDDSEDLPFETIWQEFLSEQSGSGGSATAPTAVEQRQPEAAVSDMPVASHLVSNSDVVQPPSKEDAASMHEEEMSEAGSSISDVHQAEDGRVRQPFLLRGTLRPYQHAGLEWLVSLYNNGLNGILADEMGLGKTIQTIALLAHLACDRGVWGPHLIIVPTSVILNWEMEFKRFFPGFKILTYYGNIKERKEKRSGWNTENAFNVCITSYQLVLADQHIFRRKQWRYLILDEAHNIKNFRSQRWQTLLGFHSQRRLLLTGTPLQNNLMELWSLLYFLMPSGLSEEMSGGTFAGQKEFAEWFSNPMDKAITNKDGPDLDQETLETVNKLHTLLRPYLLRRMKSEVEKQLPGKFDHIVDCRLSKRQRFLYDEFMLRASTRETLATGSFLSVVNLLMQLRKICNHPDLFEVRPIVTSFAMSRSAIADFEVKELLLRRTLLARDPLDAVDLDVLGLLFTGNEQLSARICQDVRRLDATPRLPFISELPGEPPPVDTLTIAGFVKHADWQKRAATIARWQHVGYLNTLRCSRRPVYGSELLRHIRKMHYRIVPLEEAELDRRNSKKIINQVHGAVQSYRQRAEAMAGYIDRFACVTPAVVALDLPQFALPGVRAEAHPELLDPSFDTLHRGTVKLQIGFPDASLLQYDCGKLQELDTLLRERKQGNHRVLIFTQMTRVLDILEIFLNLHGYRYLRLDGATKIEQRQIITERFNVDPRIFAFIASSRSGGVGINLTGADTVIFFDSDFNPAMDRQCEDRAHRIGQTREVHIYRFITKHTIEENMLLTANHKRTLDDVVIRQGDFDWRKILVDDLQMEQALAQVEDQADATAARMARAEGQLDVTDFEERVVRTAKEDAVGREEEEDGEEDVGGTTVDYMVTFVERDWEFFSLL